MIVDCDGILKIAKKQGVNDFQRFVTLDIERKTILNDWFEYVWKMRELPAKDHIRGFWMAMDLLDSIADIISGSRTDDDRFSALILNEQLSELFKKVISEPKSLMRMYGKRFSTQWPVFDTDHMINQGLQLIHTSESSIRRETIDQYLTSGAIQYMPVCWPEHIKSGDIPLPDWKHTLSAWYVVRKNLSGQEWNHSEADVRIHTNAFLTLLYFFKEGKVFFENPSLKPDIFDRTQVLSSL